MNRVRNRVLIGAVVLLAASVQAATTVELYCDRDVSGGTGDGSSWANAYSNFQTAISGFGTVNLAADDKMLVLHLRGATSAFSAVANCNNITGGDSTHYLSILVDAEDRHAGVWSNSKCRMVVGAGTTYTAGLYNLPAYSVVDGLQISCTGDGMAQLTLSAGTCTVRNCILKGGTRGFSLGSGGTGFAIQNCVVTGSTYGAQISCNGTFNSCTFANCGTNGVFISSAYKTVTMRNCYSGGCGTSDYAKDSTSTFAFTSCYSEDGSQSTPTAAFTTSTFVNVTGGSEDMHLVSGSALIGAGTDISAYMNPDDDIDGDSRPQNTTWDVGADEFVGAAASAKAYYYQVNQ